MQTAFILSPFDDLLSSTLRDLCIGFTLVAVPEKGVRTVCRHDHNLESRSIGSMCIIESSVDFDGLVGYLRVSELGK